MNYDNIIYPLDKIYSNATGVGYPVCGAGHEDPIPPEDDFYIKNEYAGQNTLILKRTNKSNSAVLNYSFDKTEWTVIQFVWHYESGHEIADPYTITMEAGEKVYLKTTGSTVHGCDLNITCSEVYSTGGDILNSLIKYDLNGRFEGLFRDSTTLVDASMIYYSYSNSLSGFNYTFQGCSNLKKAPYLGNVENITTSGLEHAFEGTAIETINLNSVIRVNLNALNGAFMNSQLRKIKMDNLKGTMRNGGNKAFYRAFYGCENLEKGVDLSNFELFYEAATDVFKETYYGCINMKKATAPNQVVNSSDNSIITNWLYDAGTNVQGTKTVYAPTGVTIPTDSDSGIPTGWVRVDY